MTESKAATKPLSDLFHSAAKRVKKKRVVKGVTHVDLYDVDQYVDQAVDGLVAIFRG